MLGPLAQEAGIQTVCYGFRKLQEHRDMFFIYTKLTGSSAKASLRCESHHRGTCALCGIIRRKKSGIFRNTGCLPPLSYGVLFQTTNSLTLRGCRGVASLNGEDGICDGEAIDRYCGKMERKADV